MVDTGLVCVINIVVFVLGWASTTGSGYIVYSYLWGKERHLTRKGFGMHSILVHLSINDMLTSSIGGTVALLRSVTPWFSRTECSRYEYIPEVIWMTTLAASLLWSVAIAVFLFWLLRKVGKGTVPRLYIAGIYVFVYTSAVALPWLPFLEGGYIRDPRVGEFLESPCAASCFLDPHSVMGWTVAGAVIFLVLLVCVLYVSTYLHVKRTIEGVEHPVRTRRRVRKRRLYKVFALYPLIFILTWLPYCVVIFSATPAGLSFAWAFSSAQGVWNGLLFVWKRPQYSRMSKSKSSERDVPVDRNPHRQGKGTSNKSSVTVRVSGDSSDDEVEIAGTTRSDQSSPKSTRQTPRGSGLSAPGGKGARLSGRQRMLGIPLHREQSTPSATTQAERRAAARMLSFKSDEAALVETSTVTASAEDAHSAGSADCAAGVGVGVGVGPQADDTPPLPAHALPREHSRSSLLAPMQRTSSTPVQYSEPDAEHSDSGTD